MPYRGLAGRTPASSYPDILQLGNDGDGLPASGVVSLCDGSGNASTLKLGQTQASVDFNGGILRNAITQGGCEAFAESNHVNGAAVSLNLFTTRNLVVSMTQANGSSTFCTSCCAGTTTQAAVNTINLSFAPSLTLATSELGYTPRVGGKATFVAVMPSGLTHLCRFLFASASGSVLGQFDTCIDSTTIKYVIYEIYTIPVGATYKFIVKQALTAT
jgi:hypothetical protein